MLSPWSGVGGHQRENRSAAAIREAIEGRQASGSSWPTTARSPLCIQIVHIGGKPEDWEDRRREAGASS
jgi:hypothetical protein